MQQSFLNKIKATINGDNLLVDLSKPIIVALSGGADSVALLIVLKKLGYNCIAAHCNFQLRGQESERDMQYCIDLCNKLGLKLLIKRCDVSGFIERQPMSTEMACREIRYNWFVELVNEYSAQAIATGHHIEDNVETFLLNAFRGTGISGLTGIPIKNNLNVVRPLLNVTKQEILNFLNSEKIKFVTDSSNKKNEFTRNIIRNLLVPQIKEHFPNIENGIKTTIENLNESFSLYCQSIADKKCVYVDAEGGVNLSKLLVEQKLFSNLLLYEWLKSEGFTRTQTDNMLECAKVTGKKFISNNCVRIINRGKLLKINSIPEIEYPSDLNNIFDIEIHPIAHFRPVNNPSVAYFDLSILEGSDLFIRYWIYGDRMQPFGMKGSQKLSDIFANAKISIDKKRSIPLLIKNDEIVWVAGVKCSNKYRVTDSTKQYVEIKLKNR